MEEFKKNFSIRLKKVLDGRSQSAVSERLGYSQALISKYLMGNIPDAFIFLSKLSDEYQIDLHWLITGTPSPGEKKWELQYYRALEKITKHLAKQLVYFLEEKEHLLSQLSEEEEKKRNGEDVEEDFIDELKSQITHIESDLQEISKEQPWINQAVKSIKLFQKSCNQIKI